MMPGGDSTGPRIGPQRGGRGHMGGGGPGGPKGCMCPRCKLCVPHTRGTPCKDMLCPKCKNPMIREG